MGSYSYHKDWLERAYSGVPLGEMVQWSDLIASLYVLGHSLNISSEIPSMKTYVTGFLFYYRFQLGTRRRLSGRPGFDSEYGSPFLECPRTFLGPKSHFRNHEALGMPSLLFRQVLLLNKSYACTMFRI